MTQVGLQPLGFTLTVNEGHQLTGLPASNMLPNLHINQAINQNFSRQYSSSGVFKLPQQLDSHISTMKMCHEGDKMS